MTHPDTVDVVIPARNEQDTIGPVVAAFSNHPAIGQIIVILDKDTTDLTPSAVLYADSSAKVLRYPEVSGKGQLVTRGLEEVTSDYVVFCDADITGITIDHVSMLISEAVLDSGTMLIGVPEIPRNYPESRLFAWPWVSGQRCVPTSLVRPLRFHGYLMETQINKAASYAHLPVRFEWLNGLQSPYIMSEERLNAMEQDAQWGKTNGVL